MLRELGDSAGAEDVLRGREEFHGTLRHDVGKHVFGGILGLWPVSRHAVSPLAGDYRPIRMIDSFLFNGEIAAEIRLNVTAAYFDHIMIVESWQPHSVSAPRKTRLFSDMPYWRRVFARHGSKIKVVIIEAFPVMPLSWEVYRRAKYWWTTILPGDEAAGYQTWWQEFYQRNVALGPALEVTGVRVQWGCWAAVGVGVCVGPAGVVGSS